MIKIIKLNNFEVPKDPFKHETISFEGLIKDLGMVVPPRIINRAQVHKMLKEGLQIVTIHFTYFLDRTKEEI